MRIGRIAIAAREKLGVVEDTHAHAIAENYRFYGDGDASLLIPAHP